MARKALLLVFPAVIAVVWSQWQEISRYIKLEQMSSGGDPRTVPVEGVHAYPSPGNGAIDGTGEFDSGSRGGPNLRLACHPAGHLGPRAGPALRDVHEPLQSRQRYRG